MRDRERCERERGERGEMCEREIGGRVERGKREERGEIKYQDNDNDKSLFSKLRPLLRHIRDVSIYKYNNNYSKKSTIRWKNINARLQTTQPTSGGAVTVVSSCCANCVEPPRPQQWGPDLPFFGHAGHADPLDGWRCCSQKRVMSRPIQVRQL